jgi:hypothetical protein
LIARGAVRIERDVGRELRAGLIPQFVEALKTCIERSLAAAGKSHQHDAVGIDARMVCQNVERMKNVDNEIEPAELGLIGTGRSQPASGKTVDHEG